MNKRIKVITKFILVGFVFMGEYNIEHREVNAAERYAKNFAVVNTDCEMNSYADKSNVEISRGSYDKGNEVVNYAYKFLGKPYVYGATGPNSFDCSGLTQYVYNKCGADLTRTTYTQFKQGVKVDIKNLKSVDLVFFNTQGSLSHVGIYIGGGKFIHAPRTGKPVMISSLSEGYYHDRYETARRIFY